MIALRGLARLASGHAREPAPARCELCGGPIGDAHCHIVELGSRGVRCACRPCGLLFSLDHAGARYRTVPERVRVDTRPGLVPERWAELGIPVALAFCYRDSRRGTAVVCYPGPAGVTDAELGPEVWDELRAATPLASQLEDDVEALLVRVDRRAGSGLAPVCYLVPISTAYELVGRLRASWRGFSGGPEAEAELAAWFAELDRRGARP